MFNWRLQLLQVVWYTPSYNRHSIETVFKAFCHQEPAYTQHFGGPAPSSVTGGPITGGQARANSAPGRIEFQLASARVPAGDSYIEDEDAAITMVSSGLAEACSAIGPNPRVSFVGRLVAATANEDEAVRRTVASIGLPIELPPGLSDLIFQINRPNQLEGVSINRVLRWSSELVQQITVGPGGQLSSQTTAGVLVIDLSTPIVHGEQRLLEPAAQADALLKMVEEFKRIREQPTLAVLGGME